MSLPKARRPHPGRLTLAFLRLSPPLALAAPFKLEWFFSMKGTVNSNKLNI